MWNASRKFWQLPAESKRFVLGSVVILPVTYAGLELFGLKRLLTRMPHSPPVAEQVSDVPEQIRRYARLFSAVTRRCPLPLKCLGRAVALCWLLRLRGIDATIHIGVRKERNSLDAHAWVQFGDFVINDAEDVVQRYTRIIPDYSAMNGIR